MREFAPNGNTFIGDYREQTEKHFSHSFGDRKFSEMDGRFA